MSATPIPVVTLRAAAVWGTTVLATENLTPGRSLKVDRKSTRLNSSHPSISTHALSLHTLFRSTSCAACAQSSRRARSGTARSWVSFPIRGGAPPSDERHADSGRHPARRGRLGHHGARHREPHSRSFAQSRSEEHTSELQSPVHLDPRSFPTHALPIYFLRRVRAEFEAGALGHRSFLGELSDSRRSAAFR